MASLVSGAPGGMVTNVVVVDRRGQMHNGTASTTVVPVCHGEAPVETPIAAAFGIDHRVNAGSEITRTIALAPVPALVVMHAQRRAGPPAVSHMRSIARPEPQRAVADTPQKHLPPRSDRPAQAALRRPR